MVYEGIHGCIIKLNGKILFNVGVFSFETSMLLHLGKGSINELINLWNECQIDWFLLSSWMWLIEINFIYRVTDSALWNQSRLLFLSLLYFGSIFGYPNDRFSIQLQFSNLNFYNQFLTQQCILLFYAIHSSRSIYFHFRKINPSNCVSAFFSVWQNRNIWSLQLYTFNDIQVYLCHHRHLRNFISMIEWNQTILRTKHCVDSVVCRYIFICLLKCFSIFSSVDEKMIQLQ